VDFFNQVETAQLFAAVTSQHFIYVITTGKTTTLTTKYE
jgi:hypothetical protein